MQPLSLVSTMTSVLVLRLHSLVTIDGVFNDHMGKVHIFSLAIPSIVFVGKQIMSDILVSFVRQSTAIRSQHKRSNVPIQTFYQDDCGRGMDRHTSQ